MASETAIPDGDEGNAVHRHSSSKKKQGKPSKRIHKAEREKKKRDHMNVLFVELRKAIEPAQLSSGKACIVNDTIRLLKDLLAQVDSLKKDNAALLSESHYVAVEKNELIEENSALKSQVEKLQSEITERTQSQSSVNLNIWPSQSPIAASELQEDSLRLPSTDHQLLSSSVVAPIFVVPLHHDSPIYHKGSQNDTAEDFQCNAFLSNVKKPRPRYPSPSDSWPSQILDEQLSGREITQ
ncbi:unnamed protein product [Coffea canephora]|uniref:BHLH domain-containing protein n=1 Tax=Coffea canephora TaxID=49390 RepID=A0A068U3Q9_COFCA|nr:unnamed protein product [Coffea canephora]